MSNFSLPDVVSANGASLPAEAMEVEKAMSAEMRILKEELQQKNSPVRQQDEELLSAMREQVLRLTQKEQVLEQRLQGVCQENVELRSNLASLHTRLAQHDQLSQEQSQQLAEAWQEVEAAQCRSRQLQAQVEELQEEVSLQDNGHRNTSLLSELETEALGFCREEMTQEMGSILQLLLPLTPDVNPSRRLQGGGPQEDVQVMLLRLKAVAETLAQASGTQGQNLGFVEETDDRCGNSSTAHELRDQNTQLQQENTDLIQKLQSAKDQADIVQQAIRDRDDAIAKKNLMEAELVRSKNDMMSLNNQLLEAIQRKLELSQELEAWQDDITIIINQQLKYQQQQPEQPQKKLTSNGISFFHRPGRTPSSWSSDTNQNKSQSPWKDWLRRGKGLQYGK
uniref:BICD family-like cargo adapter 1 n=1 Tax=Gouania willdenowi TaxID=441366 RepID=A0A8C5G3W9_GOUWI